MKECEEQDEDYEFKEIQIQAEMREDELKDRIEALEKTVSQYYDCLVLARDTLKNGNVQIKETEQVVKQIDKLLKP